MAHPWVDNTRPVYPGTVREGYLVKSPPLDKKGVKVRANGVSEPASLRRRRYEAQTRCAAEQAIASGARACMRVAVVGCACA